jgi:hypothetical protein
LRLAFVGACILLASLGQLALGGITWYVGIGLCCALIAVEVLRSSSALARVVKRLEHAQPCACMFTGAAGNATTGLWKGIRVQVGSIDAGLRIGIPLRKLSAELTVQQRDRASHPEHCVHTGDESFDRSLRIEGSNDTVWRCVLTAEPRSLLESLSQRATVSLHDQALDVQLTDLESNTLESLLDQAVAFAAALPEPASDPLAKIFALARTEPASGVRAGHYRWLAERGWNTHEVYRAAAADPDPAIATWGSSHLPPSGGAFR